MTLRDEINEMVGIAVGRGSLCWEPKPKGVFDSTEARVGVDVAVNAILKAIAERLPNEMGHNDKEFDANGECHCRCDFVEGHNDCLTEVKKALGGG